MKKLVFITALLCIAGCSIMQESEPAEELINWSYDFEQAKTEALNQQKPLLIDFYTDWCSWCKKMDKDIYGNKNVADFSENFVCVKIDAEKNSQLTKEFNVRGFPTTVFLNSEATVKEVVPGYLPADRFLELMKVIVNSNERQK